MFRSTTALTTQQLFSVKNRNTISNAKITGRLPIWVNVLRKDKNMVEKQMQAKTDAMIGKQTTKNHPFNLASQLKMKMLIDGSGAKFLREFDKLSQLTTIKPILDATAILAKGSSFKLYYVSLLNYLTFHATDFEHGMLSGGFQSNKENKVVISRGTALKSGLFTYNKSQLACIGLQGGLALSGKPLGSFPLVLLPTLAGVLRAMWGNNSSAQSLTTHELTHFADNCAMLIEKQSPKEFRNKDNIPIAEEFYKINLEQFLLAYTPLNQIEENIVRLSLAEDAEQIVILALEKNVDALKDLTQLKVLKSFILEGKFRMYPEEKQASEIKAHFFEEIAFSQNIELIRKYFPNTIAALEKTLLTRCQLFVVLHHRIPYILGQLGDLETGLKEVITEQLMELNWLDKLYDVESDQHSQDNCDKVAKELATLLSANPSREKISSLLATADIVTNEQRTTLRR